jgi:hypothetical protein
MRGNLASFALTCALSTTGLSAHAEPSDLATVVYRSFHCQFALPLTPQSASTRNRVGALLGGAAIPPRSHRSAALILASANYCVDASKPLLDVGAGPSYNYRFTAPADLKESLSIPAFNLTNAEMEYIDEIILSIDNTAINEAPDNVLGAAVSFSRTDAFCKKRTYTALVIGNCTGSVDLRFYFSKSLKIDQINDVVQKLQTALGFSLQREMGQDHTTTGSGNSGAVTPHADCVPNSDSAENAARCYVRFYSASAKLTDPAKNVTPEHPADPTSQTVVFGLVLDDPTNY